MWNILPADPDQNEWAKWYEKDRVGYKAIKVGVVSEREKRFSTLIQNLMTTQEGTILSTNYPYPFTVGQELYYRNAWWTITAVGERTQNRNPQRLALINPDLLKQYVLEVMRVQ